MRNVPPTYRHQALAAFALLTLASSAASAGVADTIDAIRKRGCGADTASTYTEPLWRDANLAIAAVALANGRTLPEALERAGYAAASAKSFHIRGPSDDAALNRILSEPPYCEQVVDARYTDINSFRRSDGTWIVLATPRLPAPPPDLDPSAVAERTLELVNAARSQARRCGDDRYEATTPVALSTVLTEAALAHARDMAARQKLDHIGSDGSTVGARYTRTGYAWSASDENLAAGHRDADAIVAAWLEGPAQCAKLMAPVYTEMGVAFALAPPGSNPSIYWAQALAAPR